MAAKKKNPLKRKSQDEGEAKLLADVKDPGWHVIGVMEDEEGPAFVYTIGLLHNYNHPEIIMFGLDVRLLWQIVNGIGDNVKKGQKYQNEYEEDGVLEGYRVFFRSVEKQHYREHLGYARWFYEGDDFPVLQCVWPDKGHRFPWHPEASEPFRQRQPVLYDPVSWRFQEGRNRAVFTTRQVMSGDLPILLVSHDEDSNWQFLCGTTNKMADALLVSLGSVLDRDQTLMDLADLPEGWQATRKTEAETWKRKKKKRQKGEA